MKQAEGVILWNAPSFFILDEIYSKAIRSRAKVCVRHTRYHGIKQYGIHAVLPYIKE